MIGNYKWLGIFNLFLTCGLTGYILLHHANPAPPMNVVRATRVDIVDSHGNVTASFGYRDNRNSPELAFFDGKGREILQAVIGRDEKPSLYFLGQGQTRGVSVGYLWASDSLKPGEEDPLGSWGIRLWGPGLYKSFDTFDPAKVKASPDKVPVDPSWHLTH